MNTFKLGDLVKRIADPCFDYRYMKSGEVYQITGLPEDDSESLQVNDTDDYWMKSMFELYPPTDDTHECDSELEEAYAHIESLESALEDAVLELISLRSGNHALLGAALTLTSLHTGDNTAVIDVNHNGFKPIREMTLEDWEAAQSLGWVFETNVGSEDTVERIDYNDPSYPVCFFNLGWKTLEGFENYHQDSRTEYDVNITRRIE